MRTQQSSQPGIDDHFIHPWLRGGAEPVLRSSPARRRNGRPDCDVCLSAPLQAIANLTAGFAARGIGVVTSDGVPLHIDHINATETEDLVGAAAKSYVDWYMLTQVHIKPCRVLGPRLGRQSVVYEAHACSPACLCQAPHNPSGQARYWPCKQLLMLTGLCP